MTRLCSRLKALCVFAGALLTGPALAQAPTGPTLQAADANGLSSVQALTTWTQLGADIDGEAEFDQSGTSVSLSGDRVAIGARLNDGTGSNAGQVRVYQWDAAANGGAGDWAQMGTDIDGEAEGDWSGNSVSLSGDRVAIGAYNNDGAGSDAGHVRVYQWDAAANGGAGDWAQMGTDIDGEAEGDWSGASVSLSGDRVAIGAWNNDGAGSNAGHVRVYQWDAAANGGAGDWAQMGTDIDGEAEFDTSGNSVSLSGDRVAFGATGNAGTGSYAGHVRVYQWDAAANGGAGDWAQMGTDIDGEAELDLSGTSVSLSGDRVAIGARRNDGAGSNAGHVRVYQWDAAANGGAGDWAQMGTDIDGEAEGDESGNSVSLSGDRVAIGAYNNDGTGSYAGHVRVYQWDAAANGGAGDWGQLGDDIDGEAEFDTSGGSVSLSGDRVAIGATGNDGTGSEAGHVRVYARVLPTSAFAVTPGAPVYWPLDDAVVRLDVADAPFHSLSGVLGYDHTRLAYVGGTYALGALFGTAPSAFFNDDGAGAFAFSGGRTDGQNVSTNGTAATLSFDVADAAAPGPATFTLTDVDAIDNTGATFAFDVVTVGAFTVGGVWPGDFDDDGEVDADDLLELGLAFGETGPARPGDREANLQWGARAFTPWGGSSAHADFPKSFADGDGDGTIDEADLFAQALNFGATHTVPRTATDPGLSTEPLVISLDAAPGTEVAFDLSLPAVADGLVGAAVRLGHATTGVQVVAVEAGSLFAGAMSSVHLGEAEAQAAFAHRGRDHAVSGEGTLFRIVARVDAAGATLTVPSFEVATADGGTSDIDPGTGIVVSEVRAVASRGEGPAALEVRLAPNPARSTARLAVVAPEAGEVVVDVFDALGRRVAGVRQAVAAGPADVSLPVSSLAPGLYLVRIAALGEVHSRTLTVAR